MKKILLLILFLVIGEMAFAQVEMVPVGHSVYGFLKRMQLEGFIPEYNSASLPLSRGEVAEYLISIKSKVENYKEQKSGVSSQKSEIESKVQEKEVKKLGIYEVRLGSVDKKLLEDFLVEFGYEVNKDLKKSSSLFKGGNLFDNDKQKFLYGYVDSNVSFFLDGMGSYYQLGSKGDSLGNHLLPLGELGFRIRGTLFNSVGYYIRASNGQKLGGTVEDVNFGAAIEPRLRANTKFFYEKKNFDFFEGHFRYQTQSRWLAVTLGREYLSQGFGYIDKMFLSTNTAPFDFIKLDLGYKSLKYSFTYGSLKGDSLGRDLNWKSIATHRLDVNATNWFKFGFSESIIVVNTPFSFTYLNPMSFLISADLNTGADESFKNNSILGIDFELLPFKNVAIQGTFLIDDLNFDTMFKNDYTSNDNKFGYQTGLLWNNAFMISALTMAVEYTRLDPFVYSHKSNKSQFTNWQLPLAHNLPPNSDEIAIKLDFNITNRLKIGFKYQHQRSGEGFEYDSLGVMVINYGGNINVGNFNTKIKDKFLQGNRVDRDFFTFNFSFEPIRQYYLAFQYQYRVQNLFYQGKRVEDNVFWMRVSVDY